ncbi:pyroglutamyl-peptidase I [Paenibacillus sp. GSMTC-2017]|uniref:pyroglutamyl-peptidase I n=1 Tax=Paenibacillus sp. GSMTC-2017 TaxID=2794350 RepID=UPI0018D632BA|nr:pyroglutamyl-peptidase I [Paenibacillus sp. GSMTC-2017]MBH5318419.1 pyroglutamyl-peptidase I [Paenibacillus sp. GSMTC-2017]
MIKVLLTGFDPFGGETVNPAWEAVSALKGLKTDTFEVEIYQLPTVFNQSLDNLYRAINDVQPHIAICLGQAGGRSEFSVERVAINLNDARIPDNEGNQPIDTYVFEGGPVGYWTSLPIKAIVHELKRQHVPASISYTAGTFVCNHLFYGLMHHITENKLAIRAGFIHIPFLPEQAAKYAGQPSMALDTIVKGLMITIETTIANEQDIIAAGGQIC